MVPAAIPERNVVNFSWLIKLRWSSIAGQIATILGVYLLLDIEVPLGPLMAIIGIEALSNVGCALWFQRASRVDEWHLAAVMSLDIALLTGLLFFTGGPFNPFSSLYLVNIALAAVALHAQWTWMLVGLALLSFGILPLTDFRPLPLGDLPAGERVHLVQQGVWVAFGVAAGFIVHFLWRVTGSLGQRERELGEARAIAARQQRLASLATMAAGAAHELATPLGTIALVAKELERSMTRADASAETVEDIQLIRAQVARCQGILDQMAAGVGRSSEQALEEVRLGSLVDEALAGARAAPPVQVALDDADAILRLPPHAVAQALRSLITNAQDASPDAEPVQLRARRVDHAVELEVSDRGRGMDAPLLARAGEPFFTTKPPGSGMGLGLFLSRAVVERLGGAFAIDSAPERGTRVTVRLPARVDDALDREYASDADVEPPVHPHRR